MNFQITQLVTIAGDRAILKQGKIVDIYNNPNYPMYNGWLVVEIFGWFKKPWEILSHKREKPEQGDIPLCILCHESELKPAAST